MAEVQVTGFEYPHYLHADGRFAMERDVGGGQYLDQQSAQGFRLYIQVSFFYQGMEAVYGGVCLEQRFPIELVESFTSFFGTILPHFSLLGKPPQKNLLTILNVYIIMVGL